MSTDDLVIDIKRVYRLSKGKLDNLLAKQSAPILAQLRALDEQIGRAELLSALERYLATDNDWVRQNKWPIRLFLKRYKDFLSNDAVAISKPASRAYAPVSVPSVSALCADRIVRAWNDIAVSCDQAKWDRSLDRYLCDNLIENAEIVALKCQAMAAFGKFKNNITLAWVLEKERWREILKGKYDWAAEEYENERINRIAALRKDYIDNIERWRDTLYGLFDVARARGSLRSLLRYLSDSCMFGVPIHPEWYFDPEIACGSNVTSIEYRGEEILQAIDDSRRWLGLGPDYKPSKYSSDLVDALRDIWGPKPETPYGSRKSAYWRDANGQAIKES